MPHEYPQDCTSDSVTGIGDALAGFGFTPRQREFLLTVMVHAGCFLERQYCAFTGRCAARSREFIARLVARGCCACHRTGPARGAGVPRPHKPCMKRSAGRHRIGVRKPSAGWSSA